MRLNDTEERKWPRSRGHFVCVERTVVVSTRMMQCFCLTRRTQAGSNFPDLISGRDKFTHQVGSFLGAWDWRLPADAKRVQIPATGKFKSSHKRLNPASTGLGVLVSFNPLWPLLNL